MKKIELSHFTEGEYPNAGVTPVVFIKQNPKQKTKTSEQGLCGKAARNGNRMDMENGG